ncbi:MAG: translation elongation factor 4, partial [bacterium]
MSQSNLRTFSIIAHIDHGKSTLADRILELTHTLSKREMREQVLDSMDLERERGITIKLQAVRVSFESRDGQIYTLQLIDTPGHVDFSYEVSRALAACDGAILVVDAGQGVEAQTLANVYLALEHNLEIIPVINKIDLPTADPERCLRQIRDLIGLDTEGALLVSGKTGQGVPELLEAIVERVPSPRGNPDAPLRALIFDSAYDSYKGVITYIRVRDGSIRRGDKIRFMATGDEFEVSELGYFMPRMVPAESLECGEVGYLAAVVKTLASVKVGDTVTHARRRAEKPLPGYKEVKPVVFAGLYPVISDDFDELKDAIEKLKLNDASFHSEPETSNALGFGFRCGFLGLLHMEIVQERLEREFNLELVTTAPSVGYRVVLTDGTVREVDNPSKLPTPNHLERIEEPY